MAIIFWQIDTLTFDFVIPDATLSEMHSGKQDVTEHPVEDGTQISDHLIKQPKEFSLEGVLSNTPVEYLASLRNDSDRAEQLFEKLLDLQDKGYLATILTSKIEYENMALVSWEMPRDKQRGHSIFIKLSFKEVVTVESQEVDAPTPEPQRAKKKKSSGRKSKKTASRKVESKSLALTAIQALFGAE